MKEDHRRTSAEVRRTRWPGWIWALPIAALAIVGWLVGREMVHAGPEITITFPTAAGMKPDDTTVRYKGIVVGTVVDIQLGQDRESVVVTAQMQSSVEDLLRERTRFWLVGADLGLSNLSGLKTLVTGPYIEMDPFGTDAQRGDPEKHFAGADHPPAVRSDARGTRFVLLADRLGSVSAETPVYYLGLQVGVIEETEMDDDGEGFRITAFVRAPYDRLVRDESRFWRAGSVSLESGSGGFEAEIGPLKTLLSGEVAFATPEKANQAGPIDPGLEFQLYGDRASALAAPLGKGFRYVLRFDDAVGGLVPGAPVKLRGFTIGRVMDVRLDYRGGGNLTTPVVVELDPARLGIGTDKSGEGEPVSEAAMDGALRDLVAKGLRARLDRDPPFVGPRQVVFDFASAGGPATLEPGTPYSSLPTMAPGSFDTLASSAQAALDDVRNMNLPQIADEVHEAVEHVDEIVSSPEIRESLKRLDRSLANIAHVTSAARGQVGPMIADLRDAADQADSALASVEGVLGGRIGAARGSLPRALEELSGAARAIRIFVSYLERHPEALLQGRDR